MVAMQHLHYVNDSAKSVHSNIRLNSDGTDCVKYINVGRTAIAFKGIQHRYMQCKYK